VPTRSRLPHKVWSTVLTDGPSQQVEEFKEVTCNETADGKLEETDLFRNGDGVILPPPI
jgi:hypothetical protein